MNDPVILRSTLRKVLALRPRETISETMLKLGMERLLGLAPGRLATSEFHETLEWNHARNLVEYAWDSDAEANFWGLTAQGKQKEGVK